MQIVNQPGAVAVLCEACPPPVVVSFQVCATLFLLGPAIICFARELALSLRFKKQYVPFVSHTFDLHRLVFLVRRVSFWENSSGDLT